MIAIVGAALFHLLNPAPAAAPWIGDPFQHFTPVEQVAPAPLSDSARAMIAGDIYVPPNRVLEDPCAWVVRVDRDVATLYSRRLMLTRRAANHGWHAGQFIGACDVSTVGPVTDGPLVETKLVDFPWGSR